MADLQDRNRLIANVLAELRAQLEAELPPDTATLDEIEAAVTRIGAELRRDLQQRIVDGRCQGPRENQEPCPNCGEPARYLRSADRGLTTVHGELALSRPWYHCRRCHVGFAPLDPVLGLDDDRTSAQVREWSARVGALVPSFALAQELIATLTGVQISESTVERVTISVGTALRQAQTEAATGFSRPTLPSPQRRARRLYVSFDGIFAPLREPWKRDGSLGKLILRPGECKTAVIYETGIGPHGDEGVVRRAYLSTLGDVDAFRPLARQLAVECGVEYARETIVLGDGAAWIWTLSASQFPRAVEIVDYYHASEHLWEYARARFASDPEAARAWVHARQKELLNDEMAAVLAALAAWEPHGQNDCDLQAREYGYFQRNQERMRYGTFRARGYQIGSGVMEAGCKHVVAQRLDQVGMHWSEKAAEAVLALRGALLSTPPQDLRPYLALPA